MAKDLKVEAGTLLAACVALGAFQIHAVAPPRDRLAEPDGKCLVEAVIALAAAVASLRFQVSSVWIILGGAGLGYLFSLLAVT